MAEGAAPTRLELNVDDSVLVSQHVAVDVEHRPDEFVYGDPACEPQGLHPQSGPGHAGANGVDMLGSGGGGIPEGLDTAQSAGSPLLDFILNQLAPIEQLGFLRGNIIWLSSRLGTADAQGGDAEQLAAFNLAFQWRLRAYKIDQDARQLAEREKYEAMQREGDADARRRGFESMAQMQDELGILYLDVSERIKQWHKATTPGGDVTSAPDVDRLLFDAWRIIEGVAKE